ncbi:hypothetical protein J4H86_22155 [Spiractinospora alimapuensis]|uniref:hypothetical protein n=1 Tax=Spiractinospora alimapuensis TaxID=2820884 RepID=UPI001F2BFCDE|nr:hypothetical protein [Spiractinospora alimapuensis]QVQ51471.1 hypothetical protein J4H86_22155 [Spiractinospora alimapuensis]
MKFHPPLMITVAALLTVLGCAEGTAPDGSPPNTESGRPDAQDSPEATGNDDEDADGAAVDLSDHPDAQRVEFQELTLWLPAEWEVHVDEYEMQRQVNFPEHEAVHGEIAVIATDPATRCNWEMAASRSPLKCEHVLLLSTEVRRAAHAQTDLTPDLPLAWGQQPPFCEDSIVPLSETNDNPTEPELMDEVTIDGTSVVYAEFLVPCAEQGASNSSYYTQRLWHFPRTTVVDEFEHQELAGLLEVAQVVAGS